MVDIMTTIVCEQLCNSSEGFNFHAYESTGTHWWSISTEQTQMHTLLQLINPKISNNAN